MVCDRMLDGLFRGAWMKDVGKLSEYRCVGVVGVETRQSWRCRCCRGGDTINLQLRKGVNEARCPDINGKSEVMKEIGTQDSVSHTSNNENPAKRATESQIRGE